MRMYRKIEEDNDTFVYEYLWSDYKKPYTGLVEVNKKDLSYKVLKVVDDSISQSARPNISKNI